jgi:protein-tyrosine phosphatase
VSPYRTAPLLPLERVANFRDLAGHTSSDGRRVRSGRLFRSGHLADASDGDLDTLASLGLRCVFDFRTESDIAADGRDRLPEGVRHTRLPMPDPAVGEDIRSLLQQNGPDELAQVFGGNRAADMMTRAASGLVTDRRAPYSEFVQRLSQPDSFPALFHCSAGKDRAGWAASVVLLAIGVDEEQVVGQYLLSNRESERIRERLRSRDRQDWTGLLRPLLEVRREYIESSFAAVRSHFGTFDRYLHDGLGVSPEQREQLCQALLE